MNRLKLVSLALATAGMLASGVALAALNDRGGGLLYDDVLKITWLKDANYAYTSGMPSGGTMNWLDANTWAANLSYGGYDDWRLPKMVDTDTLGNPATDGCNFDYAGTDCGYNVQTAIVSGSDVVYSELAYMFHENLGLKSKYSSTQELQPDYGIFRNGTCNGTDCLSYGQNDVGLVDNLQWTYWTGEYAPMPLAAWVFVPATGYQNAIGKSAGIYAWAVRPGDVTAPIPEPEIYAMLLAGLGMLSVVTKRRRA